MRRCRTEKLMRVLWARQAVVEISEIAGGCCLHLVLEDQNVTDGDVEFCRRYAEERGHADCAEAARRLTALSPDERREVVRA